MGSAFTARLVTQTGGVGAGQSISCGLAVGTFQYPTGSGGGLTNSGLVNWVAASTATAWGAVTSYTAYTAVSPVGGASGSVLDVCPNTTAIRIRYLGSMQTCSGRVVVGGLTSDGYIASLNTSTFNSLTTLPHSREYSAGELYGKELVVYGRKQSPISEEFVATGVTVADSELPFVAWTGFPADGYLIVEEMTTGDFRTVPTANQFVEEIPAVSPDSQAAYREAQYEANSVDVPAYLDDLVQMASSATAGLVGGFARGAVRGVIRGGMSAIADLGSGLIAGAYATQSRHQHMLGWR